MSTIVSVEQLAREFNRDVRTVQLLAKSGMPKHGHGQYNLEVCKTWYIAYLQSKVGSRSNEGENAGDYNVDLETARLKRAQADLAEIELTEKRGQVVPIAVLEYSLTQVIANARQNLLMLPGRIAPELEGETRAVIKARVAQSIRDALTELSKVKINVIESSATDAGSGASPNDGAGAGAPDLDTPADPDGDGMGRSEPDNSPGR